MILNTTGTLGHLNFQGDKGARGQGDKGTKRGQGDKGTRVQGNKAQVPFSTFLVPLTFFGIFGFFSTT